MQIFIQSFITQVVQRCIHTSVLSASGACKAGMSGMVVLLAFSAGLAHAERFSNRPNLGIVKQGRDEMRLKRRSSRRER